MTKFTIGDRVCPTEQRHKIRGVGSVVLIDGDIFLVEHDERFKGGHDGNRIDIHFGKGKCWWYAAYQLKLVESVNLVDYGDDDASGIDELM